MMGSTAQKIYLKQTSASVSMEWTSMMVKVPSMKAKSSSLIWTATSQAVSTGKRESMTLICLSTTASGEDMATLRVGKEFTDLYLHLLPHCLSSIVETLLRVSGEL